MKSLLGMFKILIFNCSPSYLACMSLWWEETGAPGGNPHKHGENMQTPHRKARNDLDLNPKPFLLWCRSANH